MFRIAWALLLIAVSQGAFAHPSACLDNYRHLAEPPQGGLGPNVVRAPRLSEVKQGRITHDAFGQSVPGKLGARYRTIRPIVENLTANAASATHLFVKFNDDTLATAADGRVSLPEPAGGQQLTGLLSAYSDFRFSTALKGGDDWLTAMRFCAAVTRGEDFADPTSFFSAPIDDKNRERAIGLLKSLLDHPSVETAWLRGRLLTPAFDIAPPTSQYEAKQDYFDAAPNGINIRNAWSVYPGSKGLNTKYADLENSWSFDHEDFPQVRDLRSIYYPYGPAHGTAVLGILSGAHNSYGIHGGVPDAQPKVIDDANGIMALRPSELLDGDAVVIEIALDHDPKGSCSAAAGQPAIPAERDDAIYNQIVTLTGLYITVYEPAGNATKDLDAPCFNGELSRSGRDSGAIFVAAAKVNLANQGGEGNCGDSAVNYLTAAYFSNYGSRIDANSWGWCVTTTGYGDLYAPGGDDRQRYTAVFGGTSGATPIVASAGIAVQGWQKARTGRVYPARTIRALLQTFGTPSSGTNFIAKQPDVGATLAWLSADDNGDGVVNGDSLSAGRLANISTRSQVGTGNDVMIAGFIIQGPTTKTVALVGTGPSLSSFGIANPLANPRLTVVRQSDQAVIATNDDWQSGPNAAQLQAAGLAPSNPLEAAVLLTLSPGAYTATLDGVGAVPTGVGVVGGYEFDAFHADLPSFANISTRGLVVSGANPMIAGFQVQGQYPRRFAIVVTGPSLTPFGLTGLPNPSFEVRASNGQLVASNDDWAIPPSNQAMLQASPYAPTHSAEAALIATFAPGLYTVVVSPSPGTAGNAIAVVGVYAY